MWNALVVVAVVVVGLCLCSVSVEGRPCPTYSVFLYSKHHDADHCACLRGFICTGSECTRGSDKNLPISYASRQHGFPFTCTDCFCVDPNGSTIVKDIEYKMLKTTDGDEIRDFKDKVFEESCHLAQDPTTPIPKPKALPFLTWLHFPKCGSSFTNVFYNYGCQHVEGSSIFTELDDSFLPTYKKETCEYCYSDCKGCFTRWAPHDGMMRLKRKGTYLKNPFREKYCVADKRGYIPGHNALTKERALGRSGTIVAIFRDPRTRLVSAYNYRKHAFGMNGIDRKHLLETTHTVEAFANFPGVSSCQTKMLTGYTCAQYVDVNENHLKRAKDVVSNHLAMGGVLEHWNASICLFHRKFGGAMHVAETANLRPTGKSVGGQLEVNVAARDASYNSRERLLHDARQNKNATNRLHVLYEETIPPHDTSRKLLGFGKNYEGDDDVDDVAANNSNSISEDANDERLSFANDEASAWQQEAWQEVPGIKDQVSKSEYLKLTRAHEPYDWDLYNFVEERFFKELEEYGLQVPKKRALLPNP